MNKNINTIVELLSGEGRLFFYGSTAILKYRNHPLKIYNILTDINIAVIGQITSDLKFSGDLGIDAYCVADEGTIINFMIHDFGSSCNDMDYLVKINRIMNDSPLFNFFYSPAKNRFYTIDGLFFRNIKRDTVKWDDYSTLSTEEIIDMAIAAGEKKIKIFSSGAVEKHAVDRYADKKSFLYMLEAVLTSRHPYYALMVLKNSALLEYFFPFLNDLKGVRQDRLLHPEGDVYEHTLYCFKFLKNPSLKLSYGLLLHDYGKSLENYNKGYKEHSRLGAKKVRELLRPLGYGEKFIRDVAYLVEYHMINSYFFRIREDSKEELFNNELGLDLLRLFKADTLGSIGKLDVYFDIVSSLKKEVFRKSRDSFKMPRDYWIN